MKLLPFITIISIVSFSCNEQTQNKSDNGTEEGLAIAYNVAVKDSAGKSNYEVFTMNLDGTNKQNITKHPDVAWTYMADEDRLYFISDRDTSYRCFFLYETDVNGNGIRKVSDLRLEDSWMDTRNDGKEIVAAGRSGTDRYQLFIIDKETGKYRQITNDTAALHRDPAFSPDGKQIAFVYQKNKRDKTQNEEIYLMNPDGTGMKQLSNYPQNDISRSSFGYKAGATHWHPKENFITYISMQGGKHNIFAVMPDGSKQWRITNNNFSEGWHDWSKDGKWLIFDMANQDESQYHIMLMNWETKQVKQLTDTTHKYQQSPVFLKVKK